MVITKHSDNTRMKNYYFTLIILLSACSSAVKFSDTEEYKEMNKELEMSQSLITCDPSHAKICARPPLIPKGYRYNAQLLKCFNQKKKLNLDCASKASARNTQYIGELLDYYSYADFQEVEEVITQKYPNLASEPYILELELQRSHNWNILEYKKVVADFYIKKAQLRLSEEDYERKKGFSGLSFAPNSLNRVTQNTCSSDYECPPGNACINKTGFGIGSCAQVVDRNGINSYNYEKSSGVKETKECFLGVDC